MANAKDGQACKTNREESARKNRGAHSRRSRQSRLRPFPELVDVALIVELPRFRIAENRSSPRNLRECEMHHVVDIRPSGSIDFFENSVCVADRFRGYARRHPQLGIESIRGGCGEALSLIDPWEHPVTQPAVNAVTGSPLKQLSRYFGCEEKV